MRRAPMLAAAMVLGALGAFAGTSHALTIDRVSSPVIFIDGAQRANYAGYRVTNDDAVDYPALWVQLGEWWANPNVRLAPLEDGVVAVGPLARGESRVVYFYLAADHASWTGERHAVLVYDAWPNGHRLARHAFDTTVEDTEIAKAVVVTGVEVVPSLPSLGGEVAISVNATLPPLYDTRQLVYTPAARLDWPAQALQLTGVHLAIPGEADVDGALMWTAPKCAEHVRHATITYTFRVACVAPSASASPLCFTDPGCERQHNDPALTPLAPIGPAQTTPLVLARTPVRAAIGAGATVVHTLTVENTGAEPATFDDLSTCSCPEPTRWAATCPARACSTASRSPIRW
ncbi:MAG: hypothetical protein U1F43_29445 [Myxococcota bacterium]